MVYRVMKPALFDSMPELGMGYHFGVESHTREGFLVLNAEYAISTQEIADPVVFRQLLTPNRTLNQPISFRPRM
jgi:hypothetical protein